MGHASSRFDGSFAHNKNINSLLLVVVDHFSKWVELFALHGAKALLIIKVLEKEIFSRWGYLKSIYSYNATNFRGKLFQKVCKAWDVKHVYTTAYHPQCNITERINRNI